MNTYVNFPSFIKKEEEKNKNYAAHLLTLGKEYCTIVFELP